jgi:hypothetical protein
MFAKVHPGLSKDNRANVGLGNAITNSQLFSAFPCRSSFANSQNLRIAQLAIVSSAPKMAFSSCVSLIVKIGTQIQMIWAHTQRIIALMKNILASWNRTKMNDPRGAMRSQNTLSPFALNCAITMWGNISYPKPAMGGFIHIFPKSLFKGDAGFSSEAITMKTAIHSFCRLKGEEFATAL